jgi:hypothetical protein
MAGVRQKLTETKIPIRLEVSTMQNEGPLLAASVIQPTAPGVIAVIGEPLPLGTGIKPSALPGGIQWAEKAKVSRVGF